MSEVLIVAGDVSGDLHAAGLARALREEGVRVSAVGGPRLREAADEFLHDLVADGVWGFVEPVLRLPGIFALWRRVRGHLRARRPQALVCVDYYGFNRWVLEAAKAEGIPAYYYISPQVWASRPWRTNVLRGLVRRMLVIFPFEEGFYREHGVPATFVGHPLLDILPNETTSVPSTRSVPAGNLAITPLRIGLLPGSRPGEVRRHLPVFLGALDRIQKDYPRLEASVFAAPGIPDDVYGTALRRGLRVERDSVSARRANLDLALTSSGTATLENALLGVPMVVAYRTSWPTYLLARALIKVPHIAMANLLAGRRLVPELVQHEAVAPRVAREALDLLSNPRRLEAMRRDLLGLRAKLGEPGASRRAAGIILGRAAAALAKA